MPLLHSVTRQSHPHSTPPGAASAAAPPPAAAGRRLSGPAAPPGTGQPLQQRRLQLWPACPAAAGPAAAGPCSPAAPAAGLSVSLPECQPSAGTKAVNVHVRPSPPSALDYLVARVSLQAQSKRRQKGCLSGLGAAISAVAGALFCVCAQKASFPRSQPGRCMCGSGQGATRAGPRQPAYCPDQDLGTQM